MLLTRKKGTIIIGEDTTQKLDGPTLTAEKMYPINCTENNWKFCLSFHCC